MKLCATIVLAVSLAAMVQGSSMSTYEDMKDKIDRYNLYSTCYGPKIAAMFFQKTRESYLSCKESGFGGDNDVGAFTDDDLDRLSELVDSPAMARFLPSYRNKRDVDEAKEEVAEYKKELHQKLVSLECTLKKMNYLDQDGNINMPMFSYDNVKKVLADTRPGADDEYVQKVTNMFQDCYDISQSWPQTMLDRNPMAQRVGRKKVFFECTFKGEGELCYKWQMYNGLKMTYQVDTGAADLGLGGDKFEQAKTAWMVMYDNMDDEYKLVNDFFFSKRRI